MGVTLCTQHPKIVFLSIFTKKIPGVNLPVIGSIPAQVTTGTEI
jgi:hypothetical protein